MGLGTLLVSIRATANEYSGDIKRIGRETKELEKSIRPIKDQAASIGTAFTAVGGAIVGAFAIAIKKAADFGDEMNDAAKKTGLSTEALSKLKLAADTSGTSFEGLTTGLKFLGKNMELANAGSKQQVAAFRAAGISAEDLKNAHGDVNVVLNKLSDTFKNSADGAGKTAVSMALLGKSGSDLIPLLDEGSDGLKKWGDEAERTGRVVSGEAAKAADEFNDKLTLLQGSLAAISGVIGTIFIPPLTVAIVKITNVVNMFREWVAAHPGLIKAVATLGLALVGNGGLLLGLAGVLAILPKLALAFTAMTGPIGITVLAIQAFVAAMIAFPKFRGVVSDALKNVIGLFALLGSQLGSVGQALMQLATGQFTNAWNTIKSAGTNSMDAMVSALDSYDSFIGAASASTDLFAKAATSAGDAAANPLALQLNETAEKAAKARDEISELSKSFISQIRPADELSEKLTVLLARFDEKDVVRAYADQIVEAAEKQREFGVTVDGTIASLEKQALAIKKAQDIIKANKEGILDTLTPAPVSGDLKNGATGMSPGGLKALEDINATRKHAAELSTTIGELKAAQVSDAEIIEKWGDEIRRAGEIAKASGQPIEMNTLRLLKQMEATQRAKDEAEKWRRVWENAVGDITAKFANGITDRLFVDRSGEAEKKANLEKQITDIQRTAERERLQGVIDSTKKGTHARTTAELQMQAFEKQVRQEESAARDKQLAKLQSSLSFQTNLFKKFASSVKGIFTDLGKSLLKILITDTFTRIAKSLMGSGEGGGLLGSLSKSLGGLLGGKGGAGKGGFNLGSIFGGGETGGLNGILGKILPQGLKTALGIGGASLLGTGTAIAGTVGTTAITAGPAAGLAIANAPMALGGVGGLAGTGTAAGTAGAGGGLGATLGALATNPITIAAAAAIVAGLLIKKFVGAGRKTANEFVQSDSAFGQNKFGQSLSNVIDPLTAMRNAGTETLKDANAAKQKVLSLWSDFQEAANEFAKKGKNQAKVVAQAFDTLRPIVNNLLGDIEKDRARLGATTGGGSIVGNGRAGPGSISPAQVSNVPQMAFGGFLARGGLAFLHRGETVIPAELAKKFSTDFGKKFNPFTFKKGALQEWTANAMESLQAKEGSDVNGPSGAAPAVQQALAEIAGQPFRAMFGKGKADLSGIVSNLSKAEPSQVSAPFHFEPTIHFHVDGAKLSDLDARELMEKFTTTLETGVRGYREKWSQLLTTRKTATVPATGI